MIMKNYTGYTLIELMVAMAVASILISVGLPKLSLFFKGSNMVIAPNDLRFDLRFARSKAIMKSKRVSICRSANAGDADRVCATDDQGWDTGWFVFEEGEDIGNVIGTYTAADDGAVWRVNTGVDGGNVTITADNADIAEFVTFTALGSPKFENGRSQSGLFRVCESGSKRGVVLSASGIVRVTKNATKIGDCP